MLLLQSFGEEKFGERNQYKSYVQKLDPGFSHTQVAKFATKVFITKLLLLSVI